MSDQLPYVICNKSSGYHWEEKDGYHFKGYLQFASDNSVFRGNEAVELLKSVKSYEGFLQLLRNCLGVFSIIVERENETWIAVDIARSMPIYYSTNYDYISDDVDCIVSKMTSGNDIDYLRLFELYTSSYVGFQNTVYKGIKQIELGCCAVIKNNTIEQTPYYIHGSINTDCSSDLIVELDMLTDQMIDRIKQVSHERQIVLSLSGGYDSRYLACSMKRKGIDDVYCYTYGRLDSFDVVQSKKVADALGYKWLNVTYDDALMKSLLSENEDYLNYSNRPDYIVYLQNYLAVKKIHDMHLVPSNSLFVTGLCNDMPTGYYIPEEEVALKNGYSLSGVADYIIADRFIKFDISNESKEKYKQDVVDYLNRMSVKVNDYQSFVSALDCVETANIHSRAYLNMNSVYDYFDYEWILPCWDRNLLDFWYSLPPNVRKGQKTYEDYIINHLAVPFGLNTKKHINISASSPFKRRIKRMVGSVLVKIAYPIGIPIRRNTDINNFSVLEVELYKRIRQKKAIKSDRAAIILLLTIYMMERRYGIFWYKKIKEYLM